MLPVTFQLIIAMVAYANNEQLARRIEYLLEEVRLLQEVYTETTGRKRIPFTDEQRRRLAIKGKALTPEEREACCQIVRPSTILTWFQKLAAQKYDSSSHLK
jgi:putative transposase